MGAPHHKEAINLPLGTWLPWPTSCRFRPCSVQFFLSQNWPLGSAQLPGPGWDRPFGSATNAVPKFPPRQGLPGGTESWPAPSSSPGETPRLALSPHTQGGAEQRTLTPSSSISSPKYADQTPICPAPLGAPLLTSVSAAWFVLSEVPGDRDFPSHLREVPSRAALLPGQEDADWQQPPCSKLVLPRRFAYKDEYEKFKLYLTIILLIVSFSCRFLLNSR